MLFLSLGGYMLKNTKDIIKKKNLETSLRRNGRTDGHG